MEALDVGKSFKFKCEANEQIYKITKTSHDSAEQSNVKTKVSRDCRRCKQKMTDFAEELMTERDEWKDKMDEKENEYEELKTKYEILNGREYPSWWDRNGGTLNGSNDGYAIPKIIHLGQYDSDRVQVEQAFAMTLGHCSIYQIDGVQNEMLWDQYRAKTIND